MVRRAVLSDSQPIGICSATEPIYTADKVAAARFGEKPRRTPQIGSSASKVAS